jgi:hypothetical protein
MGAIDFPVVSEPFCDSQALVTDSRAGRLVRGVSSIHCDEAGASLARRASDFLEAGRLPFAPIRQPVEREPDLFRELC